MSNPNHKDSVTFWEDLHRNASALAWWLLDQGPWTGIIAITRAGLVPKATFASVYAKPAGKPTVDMYIMEVSQGTWMRSPWDMAHSFATPIADLQD